MNICTPIKMNPLFSCLLFLSSLVFITSCINNAQKNPATTQIQDTLSSDLFSEHYAPQKPVLLKKRKPDLYCRLVLK
jgi:hypothetical protein